MGTEIFTTVVLSISVFLVILMLLVFLRTRKKLEIKNSEILLALIPVILGLVLFGKIQEFAFGDFKIVAAFKDAYTEPVEELVSKIETVSKKENLPVEDVETNRKASVRQIPILIDKKTEALSFELGYSGYEGSAIQKYFDMLTKYPFFKFMVINNNDGTFFGIADARQVADIIRQDEEISYFDLARWLKSSQANQLLEKLPNFILADDAIDINSNRREVLEKMNRLDLQILPVIDNKKNFVGIVDRSKLTASIVVDVAKKLD